MSRSLLFPDLVGRRNYLRKQSATTPSMHNYLNSEYHTER